MTNRITPHSGAWLTLLVERGLATKAEALEARRRLAVAAVEALEARRRAKNRRKDR